MFYYEDGTLAFIITPHKILPEFDLDVEPGMYCATFTIPDRFLNTGAYSVLVALTSLNPFYVHYAERDALCFLIAEDLSDWPMRARYGGSIGGIVRPILDFQCNAYNESNHNTNDE
jgi:hypothetical protein